MEDIKALVNKYYVFLGGSLFFRERPNKRTRILNFEDFKRTYRTKGKNEEDDILKEAYNNLLN